MEDLTPWLNRVKKASSRAEVYSILDEFRQVEWTDDQCASMAKLYVRLVEKMKDPAPEPVKEEAPAAPQDTGPVWYEKM